MVYNFSRLEQKLFQIVAFRHYRKQIVLRNLPHRLMISSKNDQSLDIQNLNFQSANEVIFFRFFYSKEEALKGVCL
jgi:hypothetical protein